MKLAFAYWLGRWRLRAGYCPMCNSSPPDLACDICAGDRDYGGAATAAKRLSWRARWDAWRLDQ